MAGISTTTINELPDVILSTILSAITDTRTRNSVSLVNQKFHSLERVTRTSLTLRGNARDLYMIPICFRSVKNLDLSKLSPWGQPILSLSTPSDPHLLAHRLRQAFPLVESLTIYTRLPSTLEILLPQWPGLRHLKLVRWHQRSQSALGADFIPLFEHCESLTSLDLSNFYFWTEDLPPVLQAHPDKAANLTYLNVLSTSFTEGFKSQEIRDITAACPNLNKFLIACTFDPRYIGFVSDETLTAIATNCPKLWLLHLVDTSSLATVRGDPDNDAFTTEDASVSREGLIQLCSELPLLEELVLDMGKNVRDSGLVLEVLKSKCANLKVLKLGQFHGVCLAIGSPLDGVALCEGLVSLSIKNCGDLSDMALIAIGRGCSRLAKFEVEGCKKVTFRGLKTMAFFVRKTLVEVKISCCKQLGALASCKAMEPIRDTIQILHIDCVWDGFEATEGSDSNGHTFDLNELNDEDDDLGYRKKRKFSLVEESSSMQSNTGNGGLSSKTWKRLKYLSLWIAVGQLLTPLPMVGLEDCPQMEEIRIKMEGDSRGLNKPPERAFGLSCLARYPRLTKLQLDFSDTLGLCSNCAGWGNRFDNLG
ncbi:F-box protein MAX2 [Melia azedarach]|uniref:F-box protein MAX2 n=1 Tax=Melia azedarach TaxID=155640 RepID=A0ACC1Z326_MELAZ|nr:F-box protein MAX2 [Melia azedarach]